ncbi:hypothetical protein BV372_28390 [Nostoc sp. T09]|uniref:hypothetical protein n=1 Tax=Nostoc sp. T09 TaxID=1932621 RepID=UPI000A3CCABE|nr:hypothetical protein [Nostoc sp. T09]OUL24979.1 hypothetical protein BV372_28390 [Nostoc sp. T09]
MKKCLYAASIVLIFSLLTIPSVLAKPKLDRGNPNDNFNGNPNVSAENYNLPEGNNNRSNAGGRLRGQERAAYVHCLNAAKKNREYSGSNNCSQNQIYGQGRNNIQQSIQNNSPINVAPTPKAE